MDEEKILVTLRLPKEDVDRLDRMARKRAVTRQTIVEQIVSGAVANVGLEPEQEIEGKPLPPSILDAVEENIQKMKPGQEISLKKLVGKQLWMTLDDPVKRLLGKEFKELVIAGEFPGLAKGRKKGNNEQQYNKE